MKKNGHTKNEPVFELVRSMSKAEKRNFKLYCSRISGNLDAKFVQLFDHLDSAGEYDEQRILAECPISKVQLPNVKAHLYRQILTSIRQLEVHHDEIIELHENMDFVRILFDRGLYRQAGRLLEKVREQAAMLEQHGVTLEAVEAENKLDLMTAARDMTIASDIARRRVGEACSRIENQSELQNTFTRIYSLYLQLGYARTQKDLDLIKQYFRPRIELYSGMVQSMSFLEKFYFYQAAAWLYYIQHNFVLSYRYSIKWVELFNDNPRMKKVMYDDYLKGQSQIFEGLFMMRKYRHFADKLSRLEAELDQMGRLNTNAMILGNRIVYVNKMNKCFIEGEFGKGLEMVGQIEEFTERYSSHLGVHNRMFIYYKIALLHFGNGDYLRCMDYLSRITSTKNPQIRRDLQCFARILNLIASYEAGIDHNLDYQIRSVYSFLVKMNDMQAVQQEMLAFLKRLNTIYADEWKDELQRLHSRLKPYENHPYERRTFYYLDLLSWLESKISGKSMGEVIRRKFREAIAVGRNSNET